MEAGNDQGRVAINSFEALVDGFITLNCVDSGSEKRY